MLMVRRYIFINTLRLMSSNDPFSTSPSAPFTPAEPSVKQAADDLRDAAANSAQDIKDEAAAKTARLRNAAGENAAKIKEAATAQATRVKEAATDQAAVVRDIAEEQWQDARVKAREIHANSEDYVRANPTKAVLAAAGIGFVIGLLSRR